MYLWLLMLAIFNSCGLEEAKMERIGDRDSCAQGFGAFSVCACACAWDVLCSTEQTHPAVALN